jgi:hypothetical protein
MAAFSRAVLFAARQADWGGDVNIGIVPRTQRSA